MPDSAVVAVVAALAVATMLVLVALYRYLARIGAGEAFFGMVLIASWGTEYALRPLSVISRGEFGRELGVLRVLRDVDAGALATASVMAFACTAIFAAALALGCRGGSAPAPGQRLASRPRAPAAGSGVRRMRLPLGALVAFGVLASTAAALQLGRLGGTLAGEPGRQNVDSGLLYILVNLAGLCVLIALVSLPRAVLRRPRSVAVLGGAYLAFVATHLLVLGGRAEIIIVTVALVLVLQHQLGRPGKAAMALGLLAATLGLSMYRVATRDAFALDVAHRSALELALGSLADPVDLVTRYDVSAYDKLVLFEEAGRPLGFGSTYLATLQVPFPSIASGLEGGNRVYTREFIPARYHRGVTFDGISMLGEARYNFGWWGAVVVSALVGAGYGRLLRLRRRGGKWLLTAALAAGLFPSLLRADALNSLALGGSLVVFTLVMWAAVTRQLHRRADRPEPPPLAGAAGRSRALSTIPT